MIGTLDRASREVTVVGGGASGLLAAWYLDRAGMKVTLLEEKDRLGGLIATTQTEWGIAESAAHSLVATPAVRKLASDLGVALTGVRPDARARYILRDGELRRFPLKPREAFAAFVRAYFVLADKKVAPDDVALDHWALRHLGRPALDYLIDPFVTGIYGAAPSELNVRAAFSRLVIDRGQSFVSQLVARRVRRSNATAEPRGRKGMCAPANGMGSVILALENALRAKLGDRVRTGSAVRALPDSPNVVLCVPAAAAASLVTEQDPKLGEALRAVRYAPLVTVTAFLERAAFERPPVGVGVLMPAREERRCLGILFNSSAFAGRVRDESSHVSLTFMFGGSRQPGALEWQEAELRDAILAEARSLFGYRSDVAHLSVHRWARAIPVYGPELVHAWRLAEAGWCSRPGRILFGNFAGQVSLRGMVDSASRLAASLQP